MAALLLNLIMYTLAILTIGLVDILIFPEVFLNFSIGCRVLIVAGGLALAGLGIIFYLLLRRQALIESVGTFFVRILRMIHCGRLADKLEKKLEVSIEKYSSLVDVIFDGNENVWKVYILNLLQRLSADYRNTFFLCSIAWRFTQASTVISNTDLCWLWVQTVSRFREEWE